MKKIWWMRRIALSGILVTLGMLLTGNIPLWMQVVAPSLAVAWIVVYDEYVFELRNRR